MNEENTTQKVKTYFVYGKKLNETDRSLIDDLITKTNDKSFGKPVSFSDIAIHALKKLGEKDISKIQESSLTTMDKIKLEHEKFMKKTGQALSFDEFLASKLKIQ